MQIEIRWVLFDDDSKSLEFRYRNADQSWSSWATVPTVVWSPKIYQGGK